MGRVYRYSFVSLRTLTSYNFAASLSDWLPEESIQQRGGDEEDASKQTLVTGLASGKACWQLPLLRRVGWGSQIGVPASTNRGPKPRSSFLPLPDMGGGLSKCPGTFSREMPRKRIELKRSFERDPRNPKDNKKKFLANLESVHTILKVF